MDARRKMVRQFCRSVMRGLRGLLKKNPPIQAPCSGCAFAPRTDRWVGFETTVHNLLKAILYKTPFYCHRNMKKDQGNYVPDYENLIPCRNYEAIRECPEIQSVLKKAADEVKEPTT